MKNFMTPVPPIELQEQFARITKQQISSEKKYAEMFEESDKLFNSLLQKAFRGEL